MFNPSLCGGCAPQKLVFVGHTMKLTRKRALVIGVVALLVALVMTPFVLRSVHLRRRRAYRKAWKDLAVERIARLSADASWVQRETRTVESGAGSYGGGDDAWLSRDIILMADGDWIVYQATGHKEDKRIDDIFIGKASNGKWHFSTAHFCYHMYVLVAMNGRPSDLAEFIETYSLEEFDGKSDRALGDTCGRAFSY